MYIIEQKGIKMGFLSIFTESTVVVTLIAFIFVIFAIRCMLHGLMGATSTLFRALGAIAFAALAYYMWDYSQSLHGSNIIDNFVFDTWADLKKIVSSLF